MRGIADLEIRHKGRLLTHPYLLVVMLTARGRRDIPSSSFDQGRPLVFDLGAGIVAVLQVRCDPTTSLAPPIAHEGSTLRVGPELIGRRQTATIAVLVDGDRPSLTCTQPVLAQVAIIPRDPPEEVPWMLAVAMASLTAPAAAATAWWVLQGDVEGMWVQLPVVWVMTFTAALVFARLVRATERLNATQRLFEAGARSERSHRPPFRT